MVQTGRRCCGLSGETKHPEVNHKSYEIHGNIIEMSYGNFGEHHNWLVVSNASYVSIIYGIILPIDFHMFQHSYNGGFGTFGLFFQGIWECHHPN